MTVTVSGRTLGGTVTVPSSKSMTHRLLICAALGDRPTVLTGATVSQDIEATERCLTALGATVMWQEDRITVIPVSEHPPKASLDCGESGSTLRFLLPVVAALGTEATFTGRGRLAERPLSPLYELLRESGCSLSAQGSFPLTMSGTLQGDCFRLDGGVSSQFISGLLMAAPLMDRNVEIAVTGAVESRPYIDLTVAAMRRFGVAVTEENNVFFVPRGRYRAPEQLPIEGDWSNGAFWLVAKALLPDNGLTVAGLDEASLQGDRAIAELIAKTEGLRVPLTVDAPQIPDLVPILAVLAAGIPGRSVIQNAARLRTKESDRLAGVQALLNALGGKVETGADYLIINGNGRLNGGTVDACNDHRLAMAAAVAACICDNPVTIVGAEAVRKSYPKFFEILAERGMSVCPPYSGEN